MFGAQVEGECIFEIITVDQVVGSYRAGALTLNISYNSEDANTSITLSATP